MRSFTTVLVKYQGWKCPLEKNWVPTQKAGGSGPGKGPGSFGISTCSEWNPKHFQAPFTISQKFQDTRAFSRTFCTFSRTICKFPGHFANFQSWNFFFPNFITFPNVYGRLGTLYKGFRVTTSHKILGLFNLYHAWGDFSRQKSQKTFYQRRCIPMLQTDSVAPGDAFRKLKHGSIIIGCWYIQWSEHLLFK